MSFVLYGSQTGQAKSISESLIEKLDLINFNAKLNELDDVNLDDISLAIIVCSTTGDGDPPENAAKFVRNLKGETKSLGHIKYAILGLGDTNYSNFCYCAKLIDKLLKNLGAVCIYQSGWADDEIGLEVVVEPWIDGLMKLLKTVDVSSELIHSIENLQISTEEYVDINNGIYNDTIIDNGVPLLGDEIIEIIKDKQIHYPLLPPKYLEITYDESKMKINQLVPLICDSPMPSEKEKLLFGSVKYNRKLTKKYALKTVHITEVNIDSNWSWSPGDSVAIVPRNSEKEVEMILDRLNVPDSRKDCEILISISKCTEKKRAKVPDHLVINENERMSLRSVFLWLCDIRQPLNKAGLRIMAEHSPDNSATKERLLQLCSKEGQILYMRCMRETSMPLLDLLNWFPDSHIPVERLLEVLPRLKPRPYSLCDLDSIVFAYSKVDITPIHGYRTRPLTGVCTSWLETLPSDVENVLPIYLRKNLNGFTVTNYEKEPYILIGPGTGVAPFLSFLQYFERLKLSGETLGPIWLFFGCRNEDRDFIFREKLEYYVSKGVLSHLCVAFSRDEMKNDIVDTANNDNNNNNSTVTLSSCIPAASCRYVQDCMRKHGDQLISLVQRNCGRIFVCGDASGMSKDVLNTWIDLFETYGSGIESRKDAEGSVTKLRLSKMYLEDVWV